MKTLTIKRLGDFEICIYLLRDDTISVDDDESEGRVQAHLRRVGDRMFVRLAGRGAEATVNGDPLTSAWTEIGAGDALAVRGTAVELDASAFVGRPRYHLVARNLSYGLHSGRVLVQRTDLCFRRKRLTAIMGPAGCGKSTLLKCLNGYLKPSSGSVSLVRRGAPSVGVLETPEAVEEWMGYVPQEEVMLPDLSVRFSLDRRLALRYPDMAPEMRARIVTRTLQQMGFKPGKRMETYLDTPIATLSGGEKRRANIAHELVLQPLVLLLDEPTSGLSSADAETITRCLKALCTDQEIAVAAVIHQPSADLFALFDDLVLMNRQGRIVYHGPAAEAFEVLSPYAKEGADARDGRNPAELLLELVNAPTISGLIGVEQFHHNYGDCFALLQNEGVTAPSAGRRAGRFLHCTRLLVGRSLRVFWKDRFTFGAALGQVPLIALMIWLAFSGFVRDTVNEDEYVRYVANFQVSYDEVLKRPMPANMAESPVEMNKWQESLPTWESLHNEALRAARRKGSASLAVPEKISVRHASQRSAIYFMLIASAIWFGVLSASKEIVCDLPLLRREVRTGVPLGAWIASKLFSQAVITGGQCALLVGLVIPALLGTNGVPVPLAWLLMWLAGISGVCLGLLVSSCSSNYRMALTLVPLLMIPQFLFGGLLRSEDAMGAAGRWMSKLTLERWGFQQLCRADRYATGGVLRLETALSGEQAESQPGSFKTLQSRLWFHSVSGSAAQDKMHPMSQLVRVKETGVLGLHFGDGEQKIGVLRPATALASMGLLALFACWWNVRRRI